MRFVGKIFMMALAVLLAAYLLPGVAVEGFLAALLVALVLALLNGFVKPLLVLITIPVTIITLGLFYLVINAVIILLADGIIGTSFEVDGFWWALLYSLLLSLLMSIFEGLDRDGSR